MTDLYLKGICNILYPGSTLHLTIGFFVVMIAGYFLGSLNFAVIISKLWFHDDIRKHGSKNAGMTNILRTYGKPAAALTLLGDALKTLIAILVGAFFLGANTAFAGTYIGGLAAILGHVYPVYYGFRGGKGIIAAAVMILFTSPLVFLIVFVIFVCIVAATKFLSMGSIMGMIIYPLILVRIDGPGMHILIAILISLFIVYLHRSNIMRLMNGTENKFSLKKKK